MRQAAWALILAAFAASAPGMAHAAPVDLELVLAVDCSRSVDAEEFDLQVEGYAAAITHPSVVSAIAGGQFRSIAVTYVQWAGPLRQVQSVPWTAIDGPAAAAAFADRLRAAPRVFHDGGTSISGVIDFARPLFDNNGFEGLRRVIDVSGDGINNSGRRPERARDEAVAAGIVINGLAILSDYAGLDGYFSDYVIGGPGAFVIAATDFDSFAAAILNKLVREIAEAPGG